LHRLGVAGAILVQIGFTVDQFQDATAAGLSR
jgi:hypothetical protein